MNCKKQPADAFPALLSWYKTYGRHDLPWRNTKDPYAIYVSEIMLQQTQVRTVLERFYDPFLQRFPTLTALAEAPLEEVLKQWQGLGYYNRAIHLHRTAQLTAPALPDSIDALMALPGIGRNTAHAIAAFAFHQPVPVMEANVRRLIYRVFALPKASEKQLWEKAFELLNKEDPFHYNQAMMDLGATVCTPVNPHCSACPLSPVCKGKEAPEAFPAPTTRKRTPIRHRNILVLQNQQGHFLLRPRTTRFLNGLYGFPETESGKNFLVDSNYRIAYDRHHKIGHIRQAYSHFRLEADIYFIRVDTPLPGRWVPKQKIHSLPLSRADIKVLEILEKTPDISYR